MSDARKNRGQGNGGEAYRNSSFWDSLGGISKSASKAEIEMEKAARAVVMFGKAFIVDGEYVEHHRVQTLLMKDIKGDDECDCNGCKLNGGYQPCLKSASKLSAPPSKV